MITRRQATRALRSLLAELLDDPAMVEQLTADERRLVRWAIAPPAPALCARRRGLLWSIAVRELPIERVREALGLAPDGSDAAAAETGNLPADTDNLETGPDLGRLS